MAIKSEKALAASHYDDWPNSQGFDTDYEERVPIELIVDGNIPAYAAGVLFRTGLGPRTIETANHGVFRVNHWFDNFAQVHRFQIHLPRSESQKVTVTYNSRLVSDGLIAKIQKTGKLDQFTFAAKYDPCMTFFQKIQSVFTEAPSAAPNEISVAVTLSANFPGLSATGQKSGGRRSEGKLATLCNKTDTNVFQMLDTETLEPIGIARQTILHPLLKGVGSAAHAKSDPATGDVFNYNLDFGRTGTYRVFKVSASTGATSILATFQHVPAYLHSLFLTRHYVILCVWNSHYTAGGASILWNRNLLDSMTFDDKKPATWFVVDKRSPEEGGKGVVAIYESDPFFCFHTINAYEEPSNSRDGGVDIVADLSVYENMDVLKRFYLDNLMSDSPEAKTWAKNATARPRYQRFRLADVPTAPRKSHLKAVAVYASSKDDAIELPTINASVFTKRHRYIYGICDSGKSTFADSLMKYDVETHATTKWSVHGHTAGEPIFVSNPDSDHEDGGVLLSVVLDGVQGKSYLLVLDAESLEEVGRAHVDGVIGFGFHGFHTKLGLDGSISQHLEY